ncbi:UNVERIFIED_ORG: type IV secretory pathway VirB10-like protein [Arthrobacter globiformis]|nr:type IV secretory pathway VirB10-like protein [Arthrobacter globiformis]
MKIRKQLAAKTILISAIIMGMGAGATAYMVKPLKPAQDKGNASIQIADEDRDKINQKAVPGKVSAPEAPVVAEKPAETTTSPVAEPEAPVEPETKPQTYKWADEMNAAAIAAADHGYVTDMVLEDFGWRVVMRDKPVWHLARQTQGTLTEQLVQVNKYVEARYAGSWAAAHGEYVSKGNF